MQYARLDRAASNKTTVDYAPLTGTDCLRNQLQPQYADDMLMYPYYPSNISLAKPMARPVVQYIVSKH